MDRTIDDQDELDAGRIAALLAPWGLESVQVGAELTVHGDRSRAWLVRDGDRLLVAKVTFDGPLYVAPGLLIAALVDAAGIPAGPPVCTSLCDVCVPIPRAAGRAWTIALLTWVPGDPIDPSEPGAPAAAGELLGRVHAALAEQTPQLPAGDLLTYYADAAARLGGATGDRLGAAVRAVGNAADEGRLECGVLYGDPSPEILRNPATGELALIDWGTPSWGPLLFDLLTWERFFRDTGADGAGAAEVRAGYLTWCPARAAELVESSLLVELIDAIRVTWS